jgi:hypothetical protein
MERKKFLNRNGFYPETKTKLPPWKLPDDKKIRFLGNAKDIIIESETMRHCVANYVDDAIKGISYFFHVEYNGLHATAQITKNRGFVEARGFRNQMNAACLYAREKLSGWFMNNYQKALEYQKKEENKKIENLQKESRKNIDILVGNLKALKWYQLDDDIPF